MAVNRHRLRQEREAQADAPLDEAEADPQGEAALKIQCAVRQRQARNTVYVGVRGKHRWRYPCSRMCCPQRAKAR